MGEQFDAYAIEGPLAGQRFTIELLDDGRFKVLGGALFPAMKDYEVDVEERVLRYMPPGRLV